MRGLGIAADHVPSPASTGETVHSHPRQTETSQPVSTGPSNSAMTGVSDSYDAIQSDPVVAVPAGVVSVLSESTEPHNPRAATSLSYDAMPTSSLPAQSAYDALPAQAKGGGSLGVASAPMSGNVGALGGVSTDDPYGSLPVYEPSGPRAICSDSPGGSTAYDAMAEAAPARVETGLAAFDDGGGTTYDAMAEAPSVQGVSSHQAVSVAAFSTLPSGSAGPAPTAAASYDAMSSEVEAGSSISSIAPATFLHADPTPGLGPQTGPRNWNADFQVACDTPVDGSFRAKLEWSLSLHRVCTAFSEAAKDIVVALVNDLQLPEGSRRFKPVNVGGIAGACEIAGRGSAGAWLVH